MRLVEITNILIQHLQRPRKHAPRAARVRVRVADRRDIRTRLVDRGMDQESRGIGWAGLVSELEQKSRYSKLDCAVLYIIWNYESEEEG